MVPDPVKVISCGHCFTPAGHPRVTVDRLIPSNSDTATAVMRMSWMAQLHVVPDSRRELVRVCFAWREGNANDVEIVDDHRGGMMSGRDFPPVRPGERLMEELMKPMGISPYRLAEKIHVPVRRIDEIVLEKRGITADTALRLSRYVGNSAQFLMNLLLTMSLNLRVKLRRIGFTTRYGRMGQRKEKAGRSIIL